MARVSNTLIGILNIITLLISILVIGAGLWLKTHATSSTLAFLQWPIIIVGLFIMVISLLGLFGSCCRVSFFLWLYLFVTVLMIVAVSCILVFGFVVTNKGGGEAVSGRGYKEYRLGGYSDWLQEMVGDRGVWREIALGLKEGAVCSSGGGLVSADEFYQKKLTPIQSGCCKPPTNCGYTYKNATYWTVPKSSLTSKDDDCQAWSNDQARLCYDCNSCKAGVLQKIKEEWKTASFHLAGLLAFLVIILSIGCCALQNNRADKYQRYRGAYR